MNNETKLLIVLLVICTITLVICGRFAQKATAAQDATDAAFQKINAFLNIKF
jgi:competence protein ComGC